jgi:hypothetical protein
MPSPTHTATVSATAGLSANAQIFASATAARAATQTARAGIPPTKTPTLTATATATPTAPKPTRTATRTPVAKPTPPPAKVTAPPACLPAPQQQYLDTINTLLDRISKDETTLDLNYQDPAGPQDPDLLRAYVKARKDLEAVGAQYSSLKAPAGWERADVYWQAAMRQFINLKDTSTPSYMYVNKANDNLRKTMATVLNLINAECP